MHVSDFIRGICELFDCDYSSGNVEKAVGKCYSKLRKHYRTRIKYDEEFCITAFTYANNLLIKKRTFSEEDICIGIQKLLIDPTLKDDRRKRLTQLDIAEAYHLATLLENNEDAFLSMLKFHWKTLIPAVGRFGSQAVRVTYFQERSQSDYTDAMIKPVLAVFTYVYLSEIEKKEPQKAHAFWEKVQIVPKGQISSDWEEIDIDIINNLVESMDRNSQNELFPNFKKMLQESLSNHPKLKKIYKRIDEQKKTSSNDLQWLQESLNGLIWHAEVIRFTVPIDIIEVAYQRENCGVNVVHGILHDINCILLDQASQDYFSKAYMEIGRLEKIRPYLLLNASFAKEESGSQRSRLICRINPNVLSVYEAFLSEVKRSIPAIMRTLLEQGHSIEECPSERDIIDRLSMLFYDKLDKVCNAGQGYTQKDQIRLISPEDLANQDSSWLDACVENRLMFANNDADFCNRYQASTALHRLILTAYGFAQEVNKQGVRAIDACNTLELFFAEYFCNDQAAQSKSHLEYRFNEYAVFCSSFLLFLPQQVQEEVIEEICERVKSRIQPATRKQQKGYVVALSNLLLEKQFSVSNQLKIKMLEALFAIQSYREQMPAVESLLRHDVFARNYIEGEFAKAFSGSNRQRIFEIETTNREKKPKLFPPPYYIYWYPFLSEQGETSINLSTTEQKCYDLQHQTWAHNEQTTEYQNVLKTISDLNGKLSNSTNSDEVIIRTVYASEMLMMGLANLGRAGKLNFMKNINELVCLMVKSAFWARYLNEPYCSNSEKRLWIQSGGFRLASVFKDMNVAFKHEDELTNEDKLFFTKKVKLDNYEKQFFEWCLRKEEQTHQWRFYFLLHRTLKYTDFDPPKLPRSYILCGKTVDEFLEQTFLQYDNISKDDLETFFLNE